MATTTFIRSRVTLQRMFLTALVIPCFWVIGQEQSLHLSKISDHKQRNIIFVLCDDQRFDAMSGMGHPFLETPNMDRMARDGVQFENAFVTTSLCSPSRASILTGLYAHNHRVVDNYNPVPKDLIFFPQYLQPAGYETAFIGKWHMGGNFDVPQRGFDYWLSFKGQGVYWTDPSKSSVRGRFVPQASRDGYNLNGEERLPQDGYITDELTEFAVDWLERGRTVEKPFLLYLSHKAVHADFIPAERHAFRYKDEDELPGKDWKDDEAIAALKPTWVKNQRNSRHGVEFAYYSNLDLTEYYRRYCETLLAVDEGLGRIFDWLESSGQLESTLLVYMSDNGFLFGEHGLIDKRNAYEESIRVPLLMHCPELFGKGRKVPQVVANIDVAPTLLAAAGLQAPDHFDGKNFLSLALGATTDWRDYLLYEYHWERNYPQTPTMHALRGERYKYIRYHGIWDLDELYDLENDPDELHNLIQSEPHQQVVANLNQRLFEILEESRGTNVPLLPDRGRQFYLRSGGGSRVAEFPGNFYEDLEK